MKNHTHVFRFFLFVSLVNVGLILFFTYQTIFLLDNDSFGIILAILLGVNTIAAGLVSIYYLLESILNELKKGNN